MDGGLIEERAFFVAEPTPFVEITAHVDDVYPQHFQRFIGFFCMVVDDGGMWEINREIVAMNTTSDVHIFGIHEESLIEEVNFDGSLCAE